MILGFIIAILLLGTIVYLQNVEPKKKKTPKVNLTQEFSIDQKTAETELELLQNKLENNEITEEEYESIRKDIISKI